MERIQVLTHRSSSGQTRRRKFKFGAKTGVAFDEEKEQENLQVENEEN